MSPYMLLRPLRTASLGSFILRSDSPSSAPLKVAEAALVPQQELEELGVMLRVRWPNRSVFGLCMTNSSMADTQEAISVLIFST